MKTQPVINLETAEHVIGTLKSDFDSHDFLLVYILSDTISYLTLLKRYGSVETTHQQVGQFLLSYASTLGIEKVGEVESENIFGKTNTCASWRRI